MRDKATIFAFRASPHTRYIFPDVETSKDKSILYARNQNPYKRFRKEEKEKKVRISVAHPIFQS